MPQLGPLVLTDRKATPVAHTFTPENISQGVAALVESAGVPLGNNRLTLALNRTKDTGRYKATMKFAFPTVADQAINGITNPVVVRTAYADLTFTFDPSSTEQERKDVVGMVQSSLDAAKALTNDVVVKLQGIY